MLQEYDLEIKDKKDIENAVADHLSRLENVIKEDLDTCPIKEEFLDECLYIVAGQKILWYADIVNYLVGKVRPLNLSFQQKKRFLSIVKYYFWDEPLLYKYCIDQVIRRYVLEEEMEKILHHYHDREVGGH